MRTVTTEFLSVVSGLKSEGHPFKLVKPEDFPVGDWMLHTVELSESTIHPRAREEAEILISVLERQGYQVKEWILADEIPHPIEVPWKSLATIVGTIVVALVAIYGLILILPYIVMAIALVGVLTLADPVLIAVVEDEKGEVTWIQIGWWLH